MTSIRIENLRKTYMLPHERQYTLRNELMSCFRKKSYQRLEVLRGVSFSIHSGQFVGIVGRNGAGKSTLLKILSNVIRADEGTVDVAGVISPFLELGVGFNHELTAHDNIYLYGALMGLSREETDRKYDEIIAFSELGDFVDAKLKTFSSGMVVRLAFSVATAVDADVYLVDEVLAVGDPAFQEKCKGVFQRFREEGKTVVFVSHNLEAMQEVCDRLIWLRDGLVAMDGDPQEVLPAYRHHLGLGNTFTSQVQRWWNKVSAVRLDEIDEQGNVICSKDQFKGRRFRLHFRPSFVPEDGWDVDEKDSRIDFEL